MTDFLLSTDEKRDSYNAILVIINRLGKMVNYKPVNTTIDETSPAKVIIDVIVRHQSRCKSIVND